MLHKVQYIGTYTKAVLDRFYSLLPYQYTPQPCTAIKRMLYKYFLTFF